MFSKTLDKRRVINEQRLGCFDTALTFSLSSSLQIIFKKLRFLNTYTLAGQTND